MSTVADVADQILLNPAQLLVAIAEHEQQAAVLALAISHVNNRGDWAGDGSVSMRAWLRDRGRMSTSDASAWLHRGRFLDKFEAVADAAVSRTLSTGQVAELEHLHQPKFDTLLAEHQQLLVEQVAALNVAGTKAACALWRQRAEAVIDEQEPATEPPRSLTMTRAGDGALLGRFVLDDAAATELEKAIRTASNYDGADDTRTVQQRNADGLFDIAAFYNKNHHGNGTPRHLPHLGISVDASTLDDSPEGVNDDQQRPMSPACTDTYMCDCIIHTIVRDADQAPQGFGRSRHMVPRKLFRQVAARDGGCRFPGCDRNVRHCDAHHIRYWRRDGLTEYQNLVLLCSRHHHYVHQLDLHLKLLPTGELHATWTDGRQRTSQPRGAPPRRPPT